MLTYQHQRRSNKPKRDFKIQWGLRDINSYQVENTIGSFTTNFEVELQNAAVARGLSPKELTEMPGIQLWLAHEGDMCKADLVIWYRLRNQLESVSGDLQRKHIDRLQRNARLKRGN